MRNNFLFLVGIFFFLFPAQTFAIPPPDLIVTVVQSILGISGIAAAFLLTTFYIFRDFITVFFQKHKRGILFVFCIFLSLAIIFGWNQHKKTKEFTYGQIISIQTMIEREELFGLLKWKQKVFLSMYSDIQSFFRSKKLPPPSISVAESFSPENAYELLTKDDGKYVLLDVREEYEQSLFGAQIQNTITARYGDIASGILPNIPKNKKVIVICYSGLRGYFTVLLLQYYGIKNAAYVQEGLNGWIKKDLPVYGTDVFTFITMNHKEFLEEEMKKTSARKIDLSRAELYTPGLFSNMENFVYEFLATSEVVSKIDEIKNEGVILLCQTESSCFDAANFAYLIEKGGGKVIGYFDNIQSESEEYAGLQNRWKEFWKNHPQK